jgi:cell division protease FtsH
MGRARQKIGLPLPPRAAPQRPGAGGRVKADNSAAARGRLPVWYWLLIPAAFLLFQTLFAMVGGAQLPYSDFKQLLHAGKVSDVTVAEQTISGTLQQAGIEQVLSKETLAQFKCNPDRECRFSTVRVADPALVEELEAAGVRFVGQPASSGLWSMFSWLLPVILLFWVASAMAKKSGMPSGWLFDIGKSKARIYVASNTDVTFNDVAGIDRPKNSWKWSPSSGIRALPQAGPDRCPDRRRAGHRQDAAGQGRRR